MGKRKERNKKPKVEHKKAEPIKKPCITRPNFTQMAVEYRKNESKILLDRVKKLGYLKEKPVKDKQDVQDS